MLVVVSWVSFWLDPHAVPARVALGVTTLLTMSTQTASINNSLPPVAYTKAIDVWQGVCVTFVFSALLEYALVNYALRADRSYILRRAMANKRRAKGEYVDDDDYNAGDDMDLDDSDDDTEQFLTQPTQMIQNTPDIFHPYSSNIDISYNLNKGNKGVLFSQDETESGTNLRRRSGALSFLPSIRSVKRKSMRGSQNKQQVKNNILMNPPAVNIQSQLDNCTKPSLLLNAIGNHTEGSTSSQYGTTGSVVGDEPRMTVINGGFVSENGAHLNSNKTSASSNQAYLPTSNMQSVQPVKLPMEKAKRIDVTARFLFPLVFATFNLAYWLTYLLQAQSEFKALLLKNDTQKS
jgi:hypothetical protein